MRGSYASPTNWQACARSTTALLPKATAALSRASCSEPRILHEQPARPTSSPTATRLSKLFGRPRIQPRQLRGGERHGRIWIEALPRPRVPGSAPIGGGRRRRGDVELHGRTPPEVLRARPSRPGARRRRSRGARGGGAPSRTSGRGWRARRGRMLHVQVAAGREGGRRRRLPERAAAASCRARRRAAVAADVWVRPGIVEAVAAGAGVDIGRLRAEVGDRLVLAHQINDGDVDEAGDSAGALQAAARRPIDRQVAGAERPAEMPTR